MQKSIDKSDFAVYDISNNNGSQTVVFEKDMRDLLRRI